MKVREMSQIRALPLNSIKGETRKMMEVASELHGLGFMPGTGGNISTLISPDPFLLQISASGIDKGKMSEASFITVDEDGQPLSGKLKPSAETLLHIAILRSTDAGSVIHTHSVNGTVLSEIYREKGYISITGYEMLKALSGNKTHECTEVIPVINNSQDMPFLHEIVMRELHDKTDTHAILLEGHGLYTWGADVFEAKRHTEAIEFLLEVIYRKMLISGKNEKMME
jgi:methylthioribulose-1-phosphate dehydratase